MKLKHIGQGYRGADGDKYLAVAPGEIVEVSDAKADQLQSDFPDEWESIKDEVNVKPAIVNRRKSS